MSLTGSAGTLKPNLHLSVASGDHLDVREFVVHERMSSLFRVEITALGANHDIDFDAVLGQPTRFTIQSDRHERFWSGICSQIQQVGADEDGLSTYHLVLVPTLWLLSQRRNYRMFQQISERDIVLKVLDEWGIKPELQLSATYKSRKYRVQYAESDYTFISRMLEDAGISFYFRQDGEETRLVLSDAPQRSPAREPTIPFQDDTSMVTGEYVTRLHVGQEVRPGKYTMRDHDYRRPASYKLLSSAEAANVEVEKKLERYHYTPGAFLFGGAKGEATPVADDRGKTRTDEAEAAALAQKRLEAKRANAKVISFQTNAMDLAPGVVMRVSQHPRDRLTKERLLVVEATHSGKSHEGVLAHHCEARSAEAAYRPKVATPKPQATGVESATVVGPAGEEIHTDEFGRVRVHFHWDRESTMDEKSSCWIHVSQPWGGAGFGGMNLPRVGQEVLVDFLGGDPDRPIITGRVYTNLQKVPYGLPGNKTQSGWKSESSPGGGGFNELRFEDAKGKEQVYVQAEKDLKKLVKNDEDVTIGRNRTKLVKANDSLTVDRDRVKVVHQNEDVTIGRNRTKLVKANDALTVQQSRTKMVQQNELETIGLNHNVSVGVNRATQVGMIDSTIVGDKHVVMISPPGEWGVTEGSSSVTMTDKKIVLDTGAGATITLEGADITLEATNIYLKAKSYIDMSSEDRTAIGGQNDLQLKSAAGPVGITATKDMTLFAASNMGITSIGVATLLGATGLSAVSCIQTTVGGMLGVTVGAVAGDVLIQGPMVKINP